MSTNLINKKGIPCVDAVLTPFSQGFGMIVFLDTVLFVLAFHGNSKVLLYVAPDKGISHIL